MILLSAPLFNITLGGKEEVEDIVESVRDKIASSAAKATYEGGEFHIDRAKKNIKEAYTTAEYPKISFMYAKWLVKREASAKREILTDEKLEERAKEVMEDKHSMILTGSLMAGIGVKPITVEGNDVTGAVVSSSEYSGDLEKGYLFGKQRTDKNRPFFTAHRYETEQAMKKHLLDHLRGEQF